MDDKTQKELKDKTHEKIMVLKAVPKKIQNLESRINELDLYKDDEQPLQTLTPYIITGTTARKNLQGIIKATVLKRHAKELEEIDESPELSFKYFNHVELSAADKKTFRKEIKKAIVSDIAKRKAELTDLTGVNFD